MIWQSVQKIIAIILIIAGVPGYKYLVKLTGDPLLSVSLFSLYEIVVLIWGFFSKVFVKLEEKWTKRLANKIDQSLLVIFSNSRKKYLKYIYFQHRFFDVNSLRNRGPYNIELDNVFIQINVEPTPAQQISSNPFTNIPIELLTGNHIIWDFINDKKIGNQNLAILGAPGCGKTTLLKHVSLVLTKKSKFRQQNKSCNYLPILLFLSEHANEINRNKNISLESLIRTQFDNYQAPLPKNEWLEKQLKSGNCLIMLDGLDEVADKTIRLNVVSWIERCFISYGNNRFIVTSRPHGYQTNQLSDITVLQVKPLTNLQIKQFVYDWYLANEVMSSQKKDDGIKLDAKNGADDLIRRLFNRSSFRDLCVNPLLLTMITNIHRYTGTLPGRRIELYAEIFHVFLSKRHKPSKVFSKMTASQKQSVLQILAFKMMAGKTNEINDEKTSSIISSSLASFCPNSNGISFIKEIVERCGLLIEKEKGVFSFSHLTFQEYLTSIHINENRKEKMLLKKINDSWWQETIRLYCAQYDASNIIDKCLDISSEMSLRLAIECFEEAHEVNDVTRKKYRNIIESGLESPDLNKRRLLAESVLRNRISNLQLCSISEISYIDTSLLTCSEYQLFIDEKQIENKYYQPDHWNQLQFSMGKSRHPILGIRVTDAISFCEWLTNREQSNWVYRIPTYDEAKKFPIEESHGFLLGYWILSETKQYDLFWINNIQEYEASSYLDLSYINDFSHPHNILNLSTLSLIKAKITPRINAQVKDLIHYRNIVFDRCLERYINRNLEEDLKIAFNLALILANYFDNKNKFDPIYHSSEIDKFLPKFNRLKQRLLLTDDQIFLSKEYPSFIFLRFAENLSIHYSRKNNASLPFEGIRIIKEKKTYG